MEPNHYVPTPQVPSTQYWESYDSERRWSSYWLQIQHALELPDGPLLEVGVGNGSVAEYLRRVGKKTVVTLDLDPLLKPDVVGDIISMPFEDRAFECVMACEVLEHMPFERAAQALREMRRVAAHGIVSVPNAGWCLQLTLASRYRSRTLRISAPWIRRQPPPQDIKEHYWELELEGYPETRFREAVAAAGWKITTSLRNRNNLYHHFFFLE